MVKAEKNGTIIAGVDAPMPGTYCQGSLDLQPDPASLRDMAARLRDDAELTHDSAAKARFLSSAQEAENRAEQVEAAALWTTPHL